MERECWPGEPFPLGPTWDGQGTNFSIFSENAEGVELCLFDADGRETRPRHVAVESRAGRETMDGLRARGHDVEVSGPWALGRVSAVAREPGGLLRAAANPRGMQGYAIGR